MAPEIFEKRYKSSIFQARTPKTPVTSHARTPKTPKVDSDGQTGQQQDDISNKHRDIWAFGCVLYELATHRQPWYEETETTSVSEPQCSTKPHAPADLKKFFARFWKKLGPFHGGWCCSFLFMLLPSLFDDINRS
jgi:serine/threonine protein kinase